MVATSWMAQRSSALSAKPKAHWRTEENRKGRLLTTLKTSSGRPLVAKKVLSDVAMVYAVKTTGDQRTRKVLTTKRPGGRAAGGGESGSYALLVLHTGVLRVFVFFV